MSSALFQPPLATRTFCTSTCRHAGSASAMPITTIVSIVANGCCQSRPSEPTRVCTCRSSHWFMSVHPYLGQQWFGMRFQVLDGAAVREDHAAHAEAFDQMHVVARDEHGDTHFVETLEDVHHFDREIGVE